jgi:hypothetical protein
MPILITAELRIRAPAEAHRPSVLLPTLDNGPVDVMSRLGRDMHRLVTSVRVLIRRVGFFQGVPGSPVGVVITAQRSTSMGQPRNDRR